MVAPHFSRAGNSDNRPRCRLHRRPEPRREKNADTVTKLIDELSGDADKMAQELSISELLQLGDSEHPNGITQLISTIEKETLLRRTDSARDLHRIVIQSWGELSRAPGESVMAYIARRKRWLQRLKALNPKLQVPEDTIVHHLLEAARLTDEQKTHV